MTTKEDVIRWLERWSYSIEKTPDFIGSVEEMAGEAKSVSNHVANRACAGCNGFGQKTYPSTSLWSGGVGGQALTEGVCDKCWGTGRIDKTGPNLRKRVSCGHCGEQKAPDKICGHCAEDL
jgi:hypothetical protein